MVFFEPFMSIRGSEQRITVDEVQNKTDYSYAVLEIYILRSQSYTFHGKTSFALPIRASVSLFSLPSLV